MRPGAMRYSPTVPYQIVSPSNPRIKRLARLADRRHRDREGFFLVEGPRLITRALAAGLVPVESYGDGTVDIPGLDPVTVEPSVLGRVSYRKRSEGLIAVFEQKGVGLEDLEPAVPALLLVTDAVEKPGNLGAILRTADAVGADAVITVHGSVDRFNPNVIRSSTGACFTVPVIAVDLAGLAEFTTARDITLVAADPQGESPLWDVDMTGPVALIVGAEDTGLTGATRQAADILVSVPMRGATDSLNASVTMALLAYEALRQRRMGRDSPPIA